MDEELSTSEDAAPPASQTHEPLLWTLVKDGHTYGAELHEQPESGWELHLIADGAMNQRSGDAGIDPAAEAENHPLAAYLRDPDVENVDVNGCDQVWITYNTGERVAAAPVAASDDAFADVCRHVFPCGSDDFVPVLAADDDHPFGRVGGCAHQLYALR